MPRFLNLPSHCRTIGYRPQVTGQVRSQVTHKNNRTLDKAVLDWRFTIQKLNKPRNLDNIFVLQTILNSTHGIIFSCWSYGISKLRNEITKVCKIMWFVRKTNHMFSLKTKCCRVITMSSPNKPCSQDNLKRVIDMQHCNPLIHQLFTESKSVWWRKKSVYLMAECYHLRTTR